MKGKISTSIDIWNSFWKLYKCIIRTLATTRDVWVPLVTLLALAKIPRRDLKVLAVTIPLTCESCFVLSCFFTCLIPNCPFKHHREIFICKIFETSRVEIKLVLFSNKSIAAGIEAPYICVIIIAAYFSFLYNLIHQEPLPRSTQRQSMSH